MKGVKRSQGTTESLRGIKFLFFPCHSHLLFSSFLVHSLEGDMEVNMFYNMTGIALSHPSKNVERRMESKESSQLQGFGGSPTCFKFCVVVAKIDV